MRPRPIVRLLKRAYCANWRGHTFEEEATDAPNTLHAGDSVVTVITLEDGRITQQGPTLILRERCTYCDTSRPAPRQIR